MHRDLLGQAFAAMRHDLRKTMLTMAGMAWGIATVVLLLAYGNGFGVAITNIFESFGATAVGIFPGRTSVRLASTIIVRLSSGKHWMVVPKPMVLPSCDMRL